MLWGSSGLRNLPQGRSRYRTWQYQLEYSEPSAAGGYPKRSRALQMQPIRCMVLRFEMLQILYLYT